MINKSGFLTFCFSFIPGAGQMYQGDMRRGISVLLALCASYWMSCLIDSFSVLIFVVWMISFFDTFNLRSRILSGTAEPDDYLFRMGEWAGLKALCARRQKLVGWGLVLLGGYTLYDKFILSQFYRYLVDNGLIDGILGDVYAVLNRMPELLGCLILIGVGVWLVKGSAKPAEPDYEEYRPLNETDREE